MHLLLFIKYKLIKVSTKYFAEIIINNDGKQLLFTLYGHYNLAPVTILSFRKIV